MSEVNLMTITELTDLTDALFSLKKVSIRTEKVARMIQREIADLLQNDFYEASQAFLTVTDVRMTPDLSIAYVNVSIMGTEEEKALALNRLELAKVGIRKALAQRIRYQVRHIPNLKFFADEMLQQASKMEELFAQIRASENERMKESGNEREVTDNK
jgi:ribosome-binding factor A